MICHGLQRDGGRRDGECNHALEPRVHAEMVAWKAT
jgi:hypothetical protein